MSNSYNKYLELKEDGVFEFDPTNAQDVLRLASERGLKHAIMIDAMDILRDDSTQTNEEVILLAAKKWNLI